MNRKHSANAKYKKQKGAASRSGESANTAPQRISWRRHLTPVKIGLGLGVVAIGTALIWGSLRHDGGGSALPRDDGITMLPSAVASLPPAPPGTRSPVNSVDPLTNKPIEPTSPSTVYKGYVVAFCCEKSSAYKGGWARLSETEKDAFVRRCLE